MISDRDEAVRYLDSLIGSGIRPGLGRMRELLAVAGNPERSVPAVLVAGTNGKGSTAATLASILGAAGYRQGLYTSPHLIDLEERWRVGDDPAGPDLLLAAVRKLEQTASHACITPTYFEALTLIAFFIFETSECDISVLEVGMGGRLDATNVVDPRVSIITAVDYDHQEWLGRTITEIAGEKLGIVRRRGSLVVSPQPEEVMKLVRERCEALDCRLQVTGAEIGLLSFETGLDGSRMTLETASGIHELRSPLAGEHQAQNVATAVLAAERLAPEFPRVDSGAIARGVERTSWRGRLESFRLADRVVLVDGAHNPSGARSAAAFIARFLPSPRALVFGALGDKDVGSMLDPLVPLFEVILLTTPDSDRALDPDQMKSLIRGEADVQVVSDGREAIRRALTMSGMESVSVCGSLYLAGTALRLLDQIVEPAA